MKKPRLIPFNFKKKKDKYLVVNLAGDFAFLTEDYFKSLISLQPKDSELENRFYFYDNKNLDGVICSYKRNKQYLKQNTSLFIFVVTNRCNLSCVYCQASRTNSADKSYDMNYDIAEKAINLTLQFPNKNITIEFQGGEPLLNFEIIEYVVTKIKEKANNKNINFSLVSNLIALEQKHINFLSENNIALSTSCDGDKEVQDSSRPLLGGSCFTSLENKLSLIKNIDVKPNVVNGILTTTKKALQKPVETIDTYLKLGLNSIYIRPINPFGLAKKTFATIGYTPEEFVSFYRKCLDYIIEINQHGKIFVEGTAQIFLKKILGNGVNHMEYRSPCGAAMGQIAINYDGNIYTCDEGRMMAQTGDQSFKVGNVSTSSYHELFDNEVTKTICLASCMEAFPRCNQCAYLPYCGVCPIINYTEEGDILKNNAFRCFIHEGIIDYLFELIDNNLSAKEIFDSWIN